MARQKRLQFKTAFDTYQVVGQLGAGGAGVVFEVAGSDGQHCALKLLDKSKTTTQKRKRFENEIHFCSRTEHPNIVRVLGSGVADDDSPFYLMPIYPSTLRKAMDSGINHADVLPIFNQLLNGLEAAHLLNVWHRDLKPENVLHDPKGNVFVLADFGIARFREEDLHTAVETSNRERLASFQYAAPAGAKEPCITPWFSRGAAGTTSEGLLR